MVLCCFVSFAQAAPELRRVVLSSGGVGQFEFEADVAGSASLSLDVPLDQVDDVLKSLVVEDPAGPMLGVRLPGQRPLSESFRTLPFKPDAFASAEALLAGLVGETVRIPATGARGAILAVSAFNLPGAPGQQNVERHRLTIATSEGVASAVLEDTPDIAFSSEQLRGQIATALAAIAAQRVQDRRTLVISLRAGESRRVRFGYVVPVPIWKASYRLTLPQGNGPAQLQAFAVVENLSGRDWHDVRVTLTSGQPVLFHTPLYASVFSSRPEAPVDVQGTLAPSVDVYAARAPMASAAAAAMPSPPAEGPVIPAPMPSARVGRKSNPLTPMAQGPREPPAYFAPPAAVAQSVAQVAFSLAAPVTAGSGQSLLLPILDRAVPATRVALYQPSADRVHPLVALRITNDKAGALPPGLVSLFERHGDGTTGYVGDARLPSIAPGEERLASFALDLGVSVDVSGKSDQVVVGGSISHGVMTLMQKERDTEIYRVTTPKDEGRTVIIEQPRAADQPLTEPAGKDVKVTPDVYRISRDIPAGTTGSITLVTERIVDQTLSLHDMGSDTDVVAMSNGELPDDLRKALQRAVELRRDVDRRQAALEALQAQQQTIVTDQTRIRGNLMSVPANSELHRRYLAKMQSQEDELSALLDQQDAARKALDQAKETFGTYVDGLKL